MKKILTFFVLLLALPAMAQNFNQSTSCDVKIKQNNCGPCPDKITLKLFDEHLQHHDSLGLDEVKFSYQIDATMSSSSEQYDRVAVYGKSSSGRFIYVMRTVDDHHTEMNGYQIWLSNKEKNAYSRTDTCYYSCGLTLTTIEK